MARKKKTTTKKTTDKLLLAPRGDGISSDALKTLTDMVHRWMKMVGKIDKAKEHLTELQEEADEVIERDIPAYMSEIDLSAVNLRDGTPVTCDTQSFASIKSDDEVKAFKWLRKHGHGDLIKNVVTATFGRGEELAAESLEKLLDKKRFTNKRKESVNHQTLNAWVRDMIGSGQPITAAITVFQKEVVKIGKPKRK